MSGEHCPRDAAVLEAFGARLAELREHAGLTQRQVAERVGKTERAVGAIERGINGTPLPEAARFAAVLGVTLPDLMDIADQPRHDTAHRRAVRELVRTARAADPELLQIVRKHLGQLVALTRG